MFEISPFALYVYSVMGGTLKVNTMFPGMIVQYSINNGTTWSDVLPDMKFDAGVVLLATRSVRCTK